MHDTILFNSFLNDSFYICLYCNSTHPTSIDRLTQNAAVSSQQTQLNLTAIELELLNNEHLTWPASYTLCHTCTIHCWLKIEFVLSQLSMIHFLSNYYTNAAWVWACMFHQNFHRLAHLHNINKYARYVDVYCKRCIQIENLSACQLISLLSLCGKSGRLWSTIRSLMTVNHVDYGWKRFTGKLHTVVAL